MLYDYGIPDTLPRVNVSHLTNRDAELAKVNWGKGWAGSLLSHLQIWSTTAERMPSLLHPHPIPTLLTTVRTKSQGGFG